MLSAPSRLVSNDLAGAETVVDGYVSRSPAVMRGTAEDLASLQRAFEMESGTYSTQRTPRATVWPYLAARLCWRISSIKSCLASRWCIGNRLRAAHQLRSFGDDVRSDNRSVADWHAAW